MNNWLNKVKNEILPLSEEKENISIALKEWQCTGEVIDCKEEEQSFDDCDLCSHPNIRYRFTIRNKFNNNELEVGSSCINKFITNSIEDIYERNSELSKAKRSIQNKKEEIRKKNELDCFKKIGLYENNFIASIYSQHKQGNGLSPKQILIIHKKLESVGLTLPLKINLKKHYFQNQIRELDLAQKDILKKYMSPSQRKRWVWH